MARGQTVYFRIRPSIYERRGSTVVLGTLSDDPPCDSGSVYRLSLGAEHVWRGIRAVCFGSVLFFTESARSRNARDNGRAGGRIHDAVAVPLLEAGLSSLVDVQRRRRPRNRRCNGLQVLWSDPAADRYRVQRLASSLRARPTSTGDHRNETSGLGRSSGIAGDRSFVPLSGDAMDLLPEYAVGECQSQSDTPVLSVGWLRPHGV